jgi:hypothetical protein
MTDEKIVQCLRSLLCAEDKTRDLTPLDLLQTTRLLLQRADESDVYASQDTIANQLLTSHDCIARSQKRLAAVGWLIIRKGGYRGRTNMLAVALDKLPIADLHRTMVSKEAVTLAELYGSALRVEQKKKFMRGWKQQWSFQIQKLIDRAKGDHGHVSAVINFAYTKPEYIKKVMRGPAALRGCWRKLNADYQLDIGQRLSEETRRKHGVMTP